MSKPKREIPIGVRSLYGHNTQQPLVILRMGDLAPQLPPAKAREIAFMLLEAAEAAEQDANAWRFFQQMGLGEAECVAMLAGLRKARRPPPDITSETYLMDEREP